MEGVGQYLRFGVDSSFGEDVLECVAWQLQALPEVLLEGVSVSDVLAEDVGVGEGVVVALGVPVKVGVSVMLGVPEEVGVAVCMAVLLGELDCAALALCVAVAEGNVGGAMQSEIITTPGAPVAPAAVAAGLT